MFIFCTGTDWDTDGTDWDTDGTDGCTYGTDGCTDGTDGCTDGTDWYTITNISNHMFLISTMSRHCSCWWRFRSTIATRFINW
jgi:hypothetical protein